MPDENTVSLSIRLPGQLHQDLSIKLIKERQPGNPKETINGLITKLLTQYVYGADPPK